MHEKLFAVMLAVAVFSGCGVGELTEAEKWWLAPPASADFIAFESGGKWGYRDRNGKTVISPRFDYAASFPGEGNVLVSGTEKNLHLRGPGKRMGRVRIGDKWGYIDPSGKILIQPQYEKALDFFADLTAVMLGGKWGYIDASGKMVIHPRFDEASPFLLGVAQVREGGKWFTIDRGGNNTAEAK